MKIIIDLSWLLVFVHAFQDLWWKFKSWRIDPLSDTTNEVLIKRASIRKVWK